MTWFIHVKSRVIHKKLNKLLELINKFGKVLGFKINIEESIVFMYANNKQFENDINKSKRINIQKN